MRVAYLGPAGTYSHEALLSSASAFAGPAPVEALPRPAIHEVVMAVAHGEV
ncbi:MAG: prephenate dehydratase domain-containing protein, partial [Solirubrobacteraceae bacterium]